MKDKTVNVKLCEFAEKERFRQCCCMCKYRVEVWVCNCGSEWDDKLILKRSEINTKHGLVGYGCIVGLELESIEVDLSKHEHSCGCEGFTIRKEKTDGSVSRS